MFKKILSLLIVATLLFSVAAVNVTAATSYPCWFTMTVWNDANYDKVMDVGEYVAGATVNFINKSGKVAYSVKTDEFGMCYVELSPADYTVQILPPAGFEYYLGYFRDFVTTDPVYVTPVRPGVLEFAYTAKQAAQVMCDFVLEKMSMGYIGGVVWNDVNKNRKMYVTGHEYETFEDGETPIAGAVVKITNSAGKVEATLVTDESGSYGLEVNPLGEYTIEVTMPDGYAHYLPVSDKDAKRTVVSKIGDETMEYFFFVEGDINGGVTGNTVVNNNPAGNNATGNIEGGNEGNTGSTPGTSNGTIGGNEGNTGTIGGNEGNTGTDGTTGSEGNTATDGTTGSEGNTATDGTTGNEGNTATDGTTGNPDEGMLIDSVDGPTVVAQLNKEEHYAYVVGYPEGTIRPGANITRQEVASIFFRLLTDETRDLCYSKENQFSDVEKTAWSNTAISTMTSAGVIGGYEDGSFRPQNNITRAEFATIAAKFDSQSYIGPDKFNDISGHWAAEYINRAAVKGWISGYEDGSFKPDAYITRAEAMTLINNVLERHVKKEGLHADMVKWPDCNESDWFYEAVSEATNSHYYEKDGKYETWTQLRETRDWSELER